MNDRQKGFTLLEMLVAIALFALLSLMGYQILYGVSQNQQVTHRHNQRLGEVQWLFRLLEHDLANARLRSERTADLQLLNDGQSTTLTLLKNHWRNPGGWFARSELEKVRWQFADGCLERISLHQPEGTPATLRPPRARLEHVQGIRWRFWSQGQWVTQWPLPDRLPEGVELRLETRDLGVLTRQFFVQETS
ncbi:TPA: type II secretion system minor pseudopilin GspJ [Serratia odorifera]|nr:type II secretion system minor pseudopilin GspJ [Serratia odorifera]